MPAAPRVPRTLFALVLALLLVMSLGSFAGAQEESEPATDEAPVREVNTAGQAVYDSVCFACHQPNGEGTAVFPPLYPNSNTDDAAYVEDVIRNGLSGPIEVNGVTYDSAMPAQNLADDEIVAVIDYVQNDLGRLPVSPGAVIAEEAFPWGLVSLFVLVSVLAVGIAYVIVTPAPAGFTWARAWWLAIILFLYFAIGTVWLPDYVINEPALKGMPELVKDLSAAGAWFIALAVGIYSLRFLQKRGRI
ncbi:MAG: c-type cytochrome [Acidimicrobiia bacterium]|nr:c-type cytochrome [Acidimicrobiia bacterium]